jgi:hypothetical protein
MTVLSEPKPTLSAGKLPTSASAPNLGVKAISLPELKQQDGSLSPSKALSPSNKVLLEAAHKALKAAEAAHQAAAADAETSDALLQLIRKAFEDTAVVVDIVQKAPRQRRQSVAEFTTMLKKEAQEQVNEKVDEVKRYAERNIRKAYSRIEDHWKIDEGFRMLGPLKEDANLARDVHDAFNLVALLPVIYMNLINWRLFTGTCVDFWSTSIPDLWHGESFLSFWWLTFAYFVTDLIFVTVLPHCVKSQRVIVTHHVATLGYISIPFVMPEYGWLMGACMNVEVNTWFLIARRFFNKNGQKMFTTGVSRTKSLRLLLVSTCFYVSWFVIRLGFYPYLWFVIVGEWLKYSSRVGYYINLIAVTPIMQSVFIYLNVKWSVDLIRSKLKGRGPSKGL